MVRVGFIPMPTFYSYQFHVTCEHCGIEMLVDESMSPGGPALESLLAMHHQLHLETDNAAAVRK